MAEEQQRPLKVFLCHASGDKSVVRVLYQRLLRDGVDAWLDQEKLLPGQDWQLEIPKAVRESDVVIVCLSNKSITKEGYVQKEIKFALDIATEKPEGTIFIIPARLEECNVPLQFASWQWVDLFESNGYERLMLSLRLRAGKLGLRVGETTYASREAEQRLDQLYTEGLAALWVEDWDKAYHRFQTILHEKPDHMQAAAKLEEAKRQKYLNGLYTQAADAQQNENWQAVVDVLEKLTGEVADYRDASLLLKNARKKKQLTQLYSEARRLYKAQQWQAVIRVFAQIAAIEPNYQDPDELLHSAEKEVVELNRLAELNQLYSQGVREMDAGQWYEARSFLEKVHKAERGFLETERLLKKVENEIIKLEELKKRNIQINTLYEQAHGLIRSKNWREALGKIEHIQRLDPQFKDTDEISKTARTALELDEQEVRKQNELAAIYAEAVRLLKEGKYQEALDKWQEVKTNDPKYPDRQFVQKTASKKLGEKAKSLQTAPLKRSIWTSSTGLLAVSAIVIISVAVAGFMIWGNTNLPPSSLPDGNSTSTPAPTSAYDNFDDPVWDGKINSSLWIKRENCSSVSQQNGSMVFKNSNKGCDLIVAQPRMVRGEELGALEAKLMIDDDHQGGVVTQEIDFFTYDLQGGLWWSFCGILADNNNVTIVFNVENPGGKKPPDLHKSIPAKYNQWYVFLMEVDPQTMTFSCQVDGETIGSVIPKDVERLRNAQFERLMEGARWSGASGTSYVDYIQILP